MSRFQLAIGDFVHQENRPPRAITQGLARLAASARENAGPRRLASGLRQAAVLAGVLVALVPVAGSLGISVLFGSLGQGEDVR